MNWDAIGAIGETLGAIAVFVSLLYLATQIRTQNKETRLTAIRELSQTMNEVSSSISSSSEMASIFNRATADGFEQLDATEGIRYATFLNTMFRTWENAYYQFADGRLDTRLWSSMNMQLTEMASSRGCQQYWSKRSHFFSEDFRRHIDELEAAEFRDVSELVDSDT